jgi:hypothetical protein
MDGANSSDNHLPEYMASQPKRHNVNIKDCAFQGWCNNDFCYTEISLGQQLMKFVFLMFITHLSHKLPNVENLVKIRPAFIPRF